MIEFTIKGRARSNQGLNKLTVRGGKAAMYQAKTIKNKEGKTIPNPAYEWYMEVIEQIQKHRPDKPLEGPLKLELDFYKKPTKQMKCEGKDYVRVRISELKTGNYWNTSPPDSDNLAKILTDALEGTFFENDKNIVYTVITKKYDVGGLK